jgi:predicted DNA-binding protein YlxM (UPF0122 family)
MIGAKKLNLKKVSEIKNLFETTQLSDGDIAEKYNVSRILINLIRNGKRWNENKEKLRMQQDQIDFLPFKITKLLGTEFSSRIYPLVTETSVFYVLIHYIDNNVTSELKTTLFEEIPTDEVLERLHNKFLRLVS